MERHGVSDKTTDEMDADAAETCPQCGGHNTIVAVGSRVDHPLRLLRRATVTTYIYMCTQCGAVSEVVETRKRHATD